MSFSYDYYKNLKQPKMFLANPNKNYIGTITNAQNIKLTLKFNNLNELSFNIYENINNEDTEFYGKLEVKRLVECQHIGWFQISKIEKKQDDTSKKTYKTITCLSLENELINRTVYNINGVFSLYDVLSPNKSLLHIISAECGYSIGHIDNELLSKYRTFSLDSAKIYNLLTTDISKSFEAIFTFDTYTRTINCYKLANMGSLTDIVVSRKNILSSFSQECDGDKILTRLKVIGGDDGIGGNVDIRAINFGLDYITNIDYYMTTEWGVSQSTINAYNAYKSKQSNYLTTYNNTLSSLKAKNSELLTLQNELVSIKALLSAQEQVRDTSLKLHGGAPSSTDTDYINFQNAITLIATYESQTVSKNSQIISKNAEINAIQTTLDNIDSDLSTSNNFTSAQIAEMNQFIMDGDNYEDSTFVITDQMTQSEVIDMKLELKSYAENELARAAQPQYIVKIEASNLFTLQDDKDELISYSEWVNNFQVGNLISIKFRDDYFTTARLMEMTIDFDNLDKLDLVFSDKSRLDNELIQLAEVIANAGRTSSTLDLAKYGYDAANSITNQVREFINGVLNATNNKIINNDNQELVIDTYGQLMRRWLIEQNKYSDYQSRWCNIDLLFTSDAWKTTDLAAGLLTLPDGSQRMGIATDVIFGNFMLTQALTVTNENNTITLNKDGAIFKNCDITIEKGTSILTLNATDGIKLMNGTTQQFYLDGSGNATFGGVLSGVSGNIGGWEISSDGLTSKNTLASINLYNQNNHAMQISYNGLHLYNHYTGNNEYLGSIVGTYNSINGVNGVTIAHGLEAEYLGIGFIDSTSPSSGADVYTDFIYTRNGYNDSTGYLNQGFHFKLPVYLANNLTVTGNINCNTINGSIPASQYWVQSSFPSMSAFNYLAARVSALEGA